MSKNKQELENRCETFDEIIKMSVEMEAEDAQILSKKDIEEMGLPLPPPDMYDRIMKECNKHESRSSNKRKITRRIILVAAVLSVLVFGALSAQAVKVYVFKITNQVTDNTIRFSSGNNPMYTYDTGEENAYKDAENDLGVSILKPAYLPEGYKYKSMKSYQNDHVIMVYENQDYTIRMTQTLLKEEIYASEDIDTKDGTTYILNAQNTQISVGEHEQLETRTTWLNAVWQDDKLMYKVDANCEKEVFENFIKSLK